MRSFVVTFFAVVVLAAFLSPMLRTVTTALKSTDQITAANAPIWPADSATIEYEGREYDVYHVPMPDGTERDLALVTKGRQESKFVDPANPAAGLIMWQGSWRSLEQLVGVRAEVVELRRGVGDHRLPAPALQHGCSSR